MLYEILCNYNLTINSFLNLVNEVIFENKYIKTIALQIVVHKFINFCGKQIHFLEKIEKKPFI